MKRRAIALAVLVVACVNAAAAPVVVTVKNLPPSELLSWVAAGCLQNGMSVEVTTDTQIVCARPMDDSMKSTFFRALATPSYSTKPIHRMKLTVIQTGELTTVAAEEYTEYQNAYGQTTRIDNTNKKEVAALRTGLEQMKARWESKADAPATSQP